MYVYICFCINDILILERTIPEGSNVFSIIMTLIKKKYEIFSRVGMVNEGTSQVFSFSVDEVRFFSS